MTGRRIALVAAVLLQLFAGVLEAQGSQESRSLSAPATKQKLTKALQEYRAKKDLHGEALTLLQLGIADMGLGNADGARSNLLEAVGKMRAQNDQMGAWLALVTLAQLEAASGRPADAIPYIEKALAMINEAKASTRPFSLKTFKALDSVSGLSLQIPNLDESTVAALKPLILQYSLEPITHDLYGSALTQVGQFGKAETALKAAAAGSLQGMYDFTIEAHFGDLRFIQKRYEEARAHYKKALDASSKVPQSAMSDQLIKAGIYERLVRLETITGHLEEAKRWSERARNLGRSRTQNQ